jgi:hypothetical protein
MSTLIVVSAIVSDLRNPQAHIFPPYISLLAKPNIKMQDRKIGQENQNG